jgi:methyl-accepting chemotaxis protein
MKIRIGYVILSCLTLLAWALLATMMFSSQQSRAPDWLLPAAWCACAAASLVSWRMLRNAERHARSLLTSMQALGAGRLEIAVAPATQNAFDQAIGHLRIHIADVVIKVRSGTAGFAMTSGLLSTDNKALLLRTDRQAALLQETASSTGQITAMVRQNADNAGKANQLIASAAEAALQGGLVVDSVEADMAAIRDSSRRIADIISVVDGIAFQTNILALNAAVEAARAGETGRGFAVVATEVRVLAQRVAAASREIQHLITDSVAKVEACDKQVLLAGASMRKIVASVTSAATVMLEISDSGREQSAGVDNINQTIAQLEQMTQENAKLVDEISASATNLHRQAVSLANVVSHFDLGSGEFGNQDDAVILVDAAIRHAQEAGMADLIDKVNDLTERRFSDRDLYLVVLSLEGEIVAHGGNPRLLGFDTRKQRDPDGKTFGLDIINVGRKQGSGWVDFKFAHPVTQEIKAKSAYVRRVDAYLVSCGFYAA